MKTRKSTQAALTQPDVSWSRKRSVRIVIRIQIQMTKKKTSNATRSASPMLMSANGKAASFRSETVWRPNAALTCSARYALPLPSTSVIFRPGRLADDDLAVHKGVDFAVVAERPLLCKANRDAVTGLDVTGVEGPCVGRGVRRAGGVGEDDLRALGDIQCVRVKFEVADAHGPRPASAGTGNRGGCRPGGDQCHSEDE